MSRWKFWQSSSEEEVEEGERRHRERYDSSPAASTIKKYSVRDEELRDLDEFNFASWDDSVKRSLRQQIRDNSRLFSLFVLFAGALVLVLFIWFISFLPGLASL